MAQISSRVSSLVSPPLLSLEVDIGIGLGSMDSVVDGDDGGSSYSCSSATGGEERMMGMGHSRMYLFMY